MNVMNSFFLSKISGVRFFRRGKRANKFVNAGVANSGIPPIALEGGFANTSKARFATNGGANDILVVQQICRAEEISNSVISLNTVQMVDNPLGPFPINIKPCRPMGLDRPSVNAKNPVAAPIHKTGLLAFNGVASFAMRAPNKFASLWFVSQKIAKALCGNILVSHDDSSIVGLVRSLDRVRALSRLRYFTRLTQCR